MTKILVARTRMNGKSVKRTEFRGTGRRKGRIPPGDKSNKRNF